MEENCQKVDNVVWDSLGGIGVNVTVKRKNKLGCHRYVAHRIIHEG